MFRFWNQNNWFWSHMSLSDGFCFFLFTVLFCNNLFVFTLICPRLLCGEMNLTKWNSLTYLNIDIQVLSNVWSLISWLLSSFLKILSSFYPPGIQQQLAACSFFQYIRNRNQVISFLSNITIPCCYYHYQLNMMLLTTGQFKFLLVSV